MRLSALQQIVLRIDRVSLWDQALCDIMHRENQNRSSAHPTSAEEIAVRVGTRLMQGPLQATWPDVVRFRKIPRPSRNPRGDEATGSTPIILRGPCVRALLLCQRCMQRSQHHWYSMQKEPDGSPDINVAQSLTLHWSRLNSE